MTDRTLQKFIRKLNQKKCTEDIFIRPLTSNVDYAIIWDYSFSVILNKKIPSCPYPFYFIKSESGVYVGTVSDMKGDLHWFVSPNCRGKGYLRNALNEVILPHLFQDNRSKQYISIDKNAIGDKNFNASLKTAKAIGFEEVDSINGKVNLELSPTRFNNVPFIDGENTLIDYGRLKLLKERSLHYSRLLLKIKSELEMSMGYTELVEEIEEKINGVQSVSVDIEDAYWEYLSRIKK